MEIIFLKYYEDLRFSLSPILRQVAQIQDANDERRDEQNI